MNPTTKWFRVLLATLFLTRVLCAGGGNRVLTLLTGGGPPGSTTFSVTLSSHRSLEVTKSSFPITAAGKLTTVSETVNLSKEDSEQLISLAQLADDFSTKSPGGCADGTTAFMVLEIGGKKTKRECRNSSKWPVGPKAQALLTAINRHFSKAMQVF